MQKDITMSETRSAAEKITKISEILGIVCEELKINQFLRAIAIAHLQSKRDECLRAYDRVMKALGVS